MSETSWQDFVIAHGRGARGDHLAHVLGVSVEAIQRLRSRGVCHHSPRLEFGALFALRHGHPPREEDWPAPRAHLKGYEWLAPELALLASLVGQVGPAEIGRVLTERLRRVTGNPAAIRGTYAVRVAMQRLGLRSDDMLGGLTVSQAAREIGTRSILDHEIETGKLRARRVGRYLVIPHAEFARWKAGRVFPPAGYVRLATLKRPLGLHSDKLSEWARRGYVPTAIRCNPCGTSERSTRWGSWYLDRKVARTLIADRRAGRPMPWWGRPDPGNLAITWRLWHQRQHPATCATCQSIWGKAGAPTTWEEYCHRYPPLAHGAKRHLTRPWTPGLTVSEVAGEVRIPAFTVRHAIRRGVLRATRQGREWRITRTDLTRWKARRCPSGESLKSCLSIAHACRLYVFTRAELLAHVASGRLRTRQVTAGPACGQTFLFKQQVRELRDELGYSEQAAARRVGVSVARLRVLLRGLEWRPAPRIPAAVVENAIKRQQSASGVTLAEAAAILGKAVGWVEAEVRAGTIRPLRTKWDRRRRYVSIPMFQRLCDVALHPPTRQRWSAEWVLLSEAANLAGVSSTTLQRWAEAGDVAWRSHAQGRRYHKRSVMARARVYWRHSRSRRPMAPAWLRKDRAA